MEKKSNIITVRFRDTQLEKLDALAQLSGSTRSEVLQEIVEAQYDKINGNPQLKQAMQKLRDIQEQVRGLQELYKG